MFKKTSNNNYEYGTQKVMVKIEGDTIRIRYVGGYLIIDKFIELNGNKKEEKNSSLNKEEKKEEENKDKNIEGNDTKITKWEYVSTQKPDKIDKKLEQYLKFFYSKRTFPKLLFKKTSPNNYEYGTQKVMVKIEGDTIRIRYTGGYLLIDKFIEMNASTEEKKVKKQNEKSTKTSLHNTKKKETYKKK